MLSHFIDLLIIFNANNSFDFWSRSSLSESLVHVPFNRLWWDMVEYVTRKHCRERKYFVEVVANAGHAGYIMQPTWGVAYAHKLQLQTLNERPWPIQWLRLSKSL
jgi:hypothetical protein